MSLSFTDIPVNRIRSRDWSTITQGPSRMPTGALDSDQPSAFERLVRIMQSNDRLFQRQQLLARRLRRARAYLADPDCNPRFGMANLYHVKLRYSGVVAQLRANRLEVRSLFATLDPDYGIDPHGRE